MIALALFPLLALPAHAASYTLYHRYLPGELVPRGEVEFDGSIASFVVNADAPAPAALEEGADWYQVALDVDGSWLTASTRACFASDATLTLTLAGGNPSAIAIAPADGTVPPDGRCGGRNAGAPGNLEVVVRVPSTAEGPQLATPVVVDTTGKEVTPPPEKTFLQKYWVGIVAAMLFFATQMGDEPRGAQGEGAQGGRAPAPAS